ncbi:MAG: DNA polymerase III subunit gamma/tau [Candidatus Eremiobacteraeota bacterium]|nr:DNA polymerase III subunit gamma/tau [Candidatus Eremiobacteraeota bacterium]
MNKEIEKTEKTNKPVKKGRLVLHRKWRSRDFNEIVGQQHVVRTLKNALSQGRIAQAYLFSGPRGTGKTSMARILAKAMNCPHLKNGEPCNTCRTCREIADGSFLDVIEMDAASHTQVDKIREFIVEKVNFRPMEAKRKVYIIDEVHKLSSYSFDALLKTIEEPPSFVVFILATTEPEKLPATIISRCQRFDFKRIPIKDIIDRLSYVSEQEEFSIEDGALNIIAQASDGALRDALVILEQSVSFSTGCVSSGEVISLLGMTHSDVLFSFGDIILNKDTRAGLQYIDEIYREGKDLHRLAIDLMEHFRRLLLIRMVRDAESILQVSDDLYSKLQGQAYQFKAPHILHIIKELMELHRKLREVGMERILWETAVVKLTRWEISPTLDGLNKKIAELEKRIMGGNQEEIEGIKDGSLPYVAPRKREVTLPKAPDPELSTSPDKPEVIKPPGEVQEKVSPVDEVSRKAPGPTMNDGVLWHQLLRMIKKEKVDIFYILKGEGAGKLVNGDYILKIHGKHVFNRDLLEKNRSYIIGLLNSITGKKVQLILETTDRGSDLFEVKQKPHEVFVQEVADLFSATHIGGD